MRRLLFTTLLLLQGLTLCIGQNIPTLHNENIENSSEYKNGNNYQKDFLLYIDMLKTTHPYYADAKHCAQLDKQARKLYKECKEISNDLDFKVCLAKVAASLHDGHTTYHFGTLSTKYFL